MPNPTPTSSPPFRAFTALNQLEKDDPAEFDALMTKLEKNMEEEAAKQGIDIEAARKKADEWIKEVSRSGPR